MINTPTNARELHDLLVQIPDLCGTFTIENENCLRWDLWEDYCLSVGVNRREACVALEKASRFRWQITHWHTDNDDILEELMSIGKKGNLLVVRQGWLWESVVHMGPEEECPKQALRKSLFSKPIILKAQ